MCHSQEEISEFETEAFDDMARNQSGRPIINVKLVDSYVAGLNSAGLDKSAFDKQADRLDADSVLKAADIIAIANRYAIGGTKATSKAEALKRIRKRFVERVRTGANVRVAQRARPW